MALCNCLGGPIHKSHCPWFKKKKVRMKLDPSDTFGDIHTFLTLLTEQFPPEPGTRHTISLAEPNPPYEGVIFTVAISADGGWHCFNIDPEDLDRTASVLVEDIARMIKRARRIALRKASTIPATAETLPSVKAVPEASTEQETGTTPITPLDNSLPESM